MGDNGHLYVIALIFGIVIGVCAALSVNNVAVVSGKPGSAMVVAYKGVVYRLVEIKGDPQ